MLDASAGHVHVCERLLLPSVHMHERSPSADHQVGNGTAQGREARSRGAAAVAGAAWSPRGVQLVDEQGFVSHDEADRMQFTLYSMSLVRLMS